MSDWTSNTYTPIDVDGALGPDTWKAFQYGYSGLTIDGIPGKATITAVQQSVGVTQDGVWGTETQEGLQRWLGTAVDGYWVPADVGSQFQIGAVTAEAFQTSLNDGTFGHAEPVPAPAPVPTGNPQTAIAQSAVQYVRGQAAGNLTEVATQAAQAAQVPASWVPDMVSIIIAHESAGDPNAVNNYDSNATGADAPDGYPQNCSRGLAQTIPSTFAANHATGTSDNIYDPVANVAAAFIYIVRTYTDIANVPGVVAVNEGRSYVGY